MQQIPKPTKLSRYLLSLTVQPYYSANPSGVQGSKTYSTAKQGANLQASQERCPLKSSAPHSKDLGSSSTPSCKVQHRSAEPIQGRRNGSEQNHRGERLRNTAVNLGREAVSTTACLQNRSRQKPPVDRSFPKAV